MEPYGSMHGVLLRFLLILRKNSSYSVKTTMLLLIFFICTILWSTLIDLHNVPFFSKTKITLSIELAKR